MLNYGIGNDLLGGPKARINFIFPRSEKHPRLYAFDQGNMEKVKTILKVIGSPFNSPQNIELDHDSTTELYGIAQKNKIGLFFLEALTQKKRSNMSYMKN